MDKNNKFLILGIVVIFGLIILLVGINRFLLPSKKPSPVGPATVSPREETKSETPGSQVSPLPTKTEEEIEIIREMKTHEIIMTGSKFEPASLTVKVHDQVKWINNDNTSHKVTGDDWGGVEIKPGRNFTQAFDKIGTYPYSCTLHPEMIGEIVVE